MHPSAAGASPGHLEGESTFSCAELDICAVIFTEHVHNSELYLVLAGKFKGTFDLFIIYSQFAYLC